ncbi:MAG TPA: methionyl-tRNA formyltransferase, partial [Lactococcus sp.]|nr:methionyl-tRNA formyltransferase [Lactococcus sp.]
TTWNEGRFKIYDSRPVNTDKHGHPGEIIDKTKKTLLVATGSGALELLEVQPAGKPKMDIVSFLNGLGQKVSIGDQFGK